MFNNPNNSFSDIKIASAKNYQNREIKEIIKKEKKDYKNVSFPPINNKEIMLSIGRSDSYSDEEDN